MQVTVQLPDDLAQRANPAREALEAFAIEGYRSGALTAHQVGELLGYGSRWETEAFLKQVQAYLAYGEDDLERDLAVLRAARGG